jgi:hypothetical protein
VSVRFNHPHAFAKTGSGDLSIFLWLNFVFFIPQKKSQNFHVFKDGKSKDILEKRSLRMAKGWLYKDVA